MTDTALHIVKLAEYKKLVPDIGDGGRQEMQTMLDEIRIPWLTELDKLDIRKTCSWPHSNTDGIIKFRLDDHFWIWKALSCLDTEVGKPRLPPKEEHEDSSESPIQHKDPRESPVQSWKDISRRLSPNNLQRTVLQRFTAENDVLKPGKRMLAVTRSAMDVRFLLHARDTALLYGEDSRFFVPDNSFRELWKNTVNAQPHHEENMYTDSDNPLRYALGVAMGVRGYTLNRTSTASELVKRSLKILIDTSGSDAFFPGQLDETAMEPIIFTEEEHRDHFYHTGFEINYVLLSSASKINDLFSKRETSLTVESYSQNPPQVATNTEPRGQPGEAGISRTNSKKEHQAVVMKKSHPFTNVIPAINVNHIGDEWLYQYPDFLRGQKLAAESGEASEAESNERSEDNSSASDSEAESSRSRVSSHIVNIRKGKRQKRHNTTTGLGVKWTYDQCDDVQELRDCLKKPRTVWNAKKRIIWLPHANNKTVSILCAASSGREESELYQFFERHTSYAKDVRDKTSLVSNEWQTELYLSFYLLVEIDNTIESWAECGLPDRDNNSVAFPGQAGLEIRRASMSFRFDGDFFDRFWTCHFIEHLPIAKYRGAWDHSFKRYGDDVDRQWAQRKVLELYFLKRILGRMDDESKRFPKEVRDVLGIEPGSLALASLKPIKRPIKDLQRFEKMLQLVEEDMAANLNTLRDKWNRRETDRGAEQPRWTPNDEKKYRTNINRLSVDVEKATGRLKATQDDIRKLKGFLATTQKNMRDDADRERDERDRARAERDRDRDERDRARVERDRLRDADLRYLTYVTVIFQPLGFAASFYSMGGAPEPSLIVSMVEFSAAAFAVTLVLIWGYRAIASRDDEDGVLQRFSKKSGKQYRDSKQALVEGKHKLSPQDVVRVGRGLFERIARYILTVLHWCWGRYSLYRSRMACLIYLTDCAH